MTYDQVIARRIRDELDGEPDLTERKMFGGLGFMIQGNMAVAANSRGHLMVRVNPEVGESLLNEHVRPMEMRGRPMKGWLEVDAEAVQSDAELARFVALGSAYARSLPPK